jgi:uncharacterized membrane protein YqjE
MLNKHQNKMVNYFFMSLFPTSKISKNIQAILAIILEHFLALTGLASLEGEELLQKSFLQFLLLFVGMVLVLLGYLGLLLAGAILLVIHYHYCPWLLLLTLGGVHLLLGVFLLFLFWPFRTNTKENKTILFPRTQQQLQYDIELLRQTKKGEKNP